MVVKKHIRKNAYRRRPAGAPPDWRRPLGRAAAAAGVLLGLTLTSFLLVFVHDLLTQCDYFRGSRIVVQGTDRLGAEEVLSQSGVHPGDNILSVNLRLTRCKLLAHPWIADAQVSRELPDGILIRIQEQQPLAILDVGRKFLLNAAGEIFKAWEPEDPADLPLITGLALSDVSVGGAPRSLPFAAVMEILQIERNAEVPRLGYLIRQIRVDRELGLTLLGTDRVQSVCLGYSDYGAKYRRLERVLSQLPAASEFGNIDMIDLKNLNRVVIRPLTPDTPEGSEKEET
ncbi:MAG: FtsQ-type POTRA domain-containing protein [Desulfobacterales bacterium]|jgi:cell division protein FtsQ